MYVNLLNRSEYQLKLYQTNSKHNTLLCVILSCIAVYFVIWAFTGQFPWSENPYNSYVLQVKSWFSGHTDLGRNYEHLELAVYNGKYYVSFPPIPSVLLIPFVVLNIPDGFASLLISLFSAVYTFKLCHRYNAENPLFWTLFLLVASNVLLVSISPWVWFIAQNSAFLFTMMSLYFASEKKGTTSLFCWALAIGCRPFQIVYLPLILYILGFGKVKLSESLNWFILPTSLATLYMLYNYIRFDSIFEFGHNYLPEFTSAPNGQFNTAYIAENLKSLIRLPSLGANGELVFPRFDGMSIFLCFPIVISCIIRIPHAKKRSIIISLLCVALHILLLTSHKTMGGFHFGNRYFIDVMPCIFHMLLLSSANNHKRAYPLFLFGIVLNSYGIINMFLNA